MTTAVVAGRAAEPDRNGPDRLLRRRADLPAAHPDRGPLRLAAIEAGLPVAAMLARRYTGRGESYADLCQVAYVGLVKAVDRFDPGHPGGFWSFAAPTITGEIKRYFRDSTSVIRVPRRRHDLRQKINRCCDELIQRLNRMPNADDLAAHLGEDRDEIAHTVATDARWTRSVFTARSGAGGGDPVDLLGTHDARYDLVDLSESLAPALARLPERDRRIVAMRFAAEMTQSQIAAEIGVSQRRVSRILGRVLRELGAGLRAT